MLYSGLMVMAVYYWTAFIAQLMAYFIVLVPLLYQWLTLFWWGLVLMTCVDDLDVWMTLQEYWWLVLMTWMYGWLYRSIAHLFIQGYVLTDFAMMALVLQIGPLLRGVSSLECMEEWFFAALMYFDISYDILSKWFSSALVCIVIV